MGAWWDLRSGRGRGQAMSLEGQTRDRKLYPEINAQELGQASHLFCDFVSPTAERGQRGHLFLRAVMRTP